LPPGKRGAVASRTSVLDLRRAPRIVLYFVLRCRLAINLRLLRPQSQVRVERAHLLTCRNRRQDRRLRWIGLPPSWWRWRATGLLRIRRRSAAAAGQPYDRDVLLALRARGCIRSRLWLARVG